MSTLSSDGGTVDPKRLGDLRSVAVEFLEADGGGLILLDCLDYLVLHNGPERVARALADVHDDVSLHGGALIVFVDATTVNPRLVAWQAREFDPLPSVDPGTAPAADGLTA